jgi:ABC-type Na+ transport system ATPase subunit NatA
MSDTNLAEVLKFIGQAVIQDNALRNLATSGFTIVYEKMAVEQLLYCAVTSSITPKAFESNIFQEMKEAGDSPILALGSKILADIASECIWKAIRKRNLEMTVLTAFQQGLVIAQKNCHY